MGKPILIVQGGQYGSEAKGLITAKLTNDRKVQVAIRTGTVNAGHTVKYKGRAYAMQQLPVSWIRPECKLVVGPGAYVHPEILMREIAWIEEAMPHLYVRDRIFIDRNCGLHLPVHTERSTASGRHHSMGATGKGCSEAVVDKIKGRGDGGFLFIDWLQKQGSSLGLQVVDTVGLVNLWFDAGQQLLIEGTQGTLLDLHLGHYPYVTHKQTQAASWMAEAGLSPALPVEIVSVMRTFPIRVAGNSGPFPKEVSWTTLARCMNKNAGREIVARDALMEWEAAVMLHVGDHNKDPAYWSQQYREQYTAAASEIHARAWHSLSQPVRDELAKLFELTTVTKKLRRIAMWDDEEAIRSITLNRPASVALTFMNYAFPRAWGVTRATFGNLPIAERVAILDYVRTKAAVLRTPISYVGFGPEESSTFLLYPEELEAVR